MNLLRILLAIHASEIGLAMQLLIRLFVVKNFLLRILIAGKNYAIYMIQLNLSSAREMFQVKNVQTLIDKGLQAIKNLLDRNFPDERQLQPVRVNRTTHRPVTTGFTQKSGRSL